jgi:hypothetical protein
MKIKIELLYDVVISLLGISSKNMKTGLWKTTDSSMFT